MTDMNKLRMWSTKCSAGNVMTGFTLAKLAGDCVTELKTIEDMPTGGTPHIQWVDTSHCQDMMHGISKSLP